MADFAAIFLGACLVNNLVLDAMLGIPAAIAVSKKISTAIYMSIAMLIAVTLSTVITYLIFLNIITPFGLTELRTVCFLLVIILTIKSAEQLIAWVRYELYLKIKVYVPLTLVNSTVLGICLLSIQRVTGVIYSLFFGVGAAAGFALITIALASMQDRHNSIDVPGPFRGLPVTLITLGIMSMAFMGFIGIIQL